VEPDVAQQTGGTGGTTPLDAMMSNGGTGGARDAAPDLAAPPDVAMDLAKVDTSPDSAPDMSSETGGQGKTVLLVMGYAPPKDPIANVKPGDAKMKMRLEGRGFTVKLGNDDDPDASMATGTDLVIISESAGPQVMAKYTMVTMPLICADSGLFVALKMAATVGVANNVTQVAITATGMAHPLAGGMMGSVVVVGANTPASWGTPAAAAERVATVPNQANQVAIFGYPSGAMMEGLAAPAKRVGFFATDAMAAAMNEAGWKLFDAAVDWATQ
jgi:hypothetical protein